MLEITLQFKSVDEAIVALGKLAGGKVAAAVEKPAAEKATVVAENAAPTVEKRKRKPRADAGQSRGPNARTAPTDPLIANLAAGTAIVNPPQQAPQTPADTPPELPKQEAPAASSTGEPPPQSDAEAALTAVFEQKGLVTAQEVLARFGLKRLKDILPEQRAGFIEAAKAVLEGGTA